MVSFNGKQEIKEFKVELRRKEGREILVCVAFPIPLRNAFDFNRLIIFSSLFSASPEDEISEIWDLLNYRLDKLDCIVDDKRRMNLRGERVWETTIQVNMKWIL